jgi:CubicO group peptidase (beta-lactamase class C family)
VGILLERYVFRKEECAMRALKKLIAWLLFLMCAQAVAIGQDKSKKIDEFIQPFVGANQFSGVVLASENGKVVYDRAFGLANADYKIPNAKVTHVSA